MNRILLVILAVILIIGMFTTGCGGGPCVKKLAGIRDIDIWADESLPPQYLLYLVTVQSDGCEEFDSYNVTHADNTTIVVDVFNLDCPKGCPTAESYSEVTIPLGSDFIPCGNYTVKVNDVTVSFIAGVIMLNPAPILDIEVWNDGSSPSEYFVDVLTDEPSICDYFDSYNVTRASNTSIIVEVFNRRCCTGCPDDMYSEYDWHTIPIGNNFVPGGNYTVVVNDVTETFVA
jgi:hypothetical protein